MFGAALGVGVLPPRVAVRGLLGILFLLGGINNLVMWLHSKQLVHSKIRLVVPGLPPMMTSLAALVTTVSQIAAASLFLLGVREKQAAAVLALFLVVVTPTVHNFWDANVPGDPAWEDVAAAEAAGASGGEVDVGGRATGQDEVSEVEEDEDEGEETEEANVARKEVEEEESLPSSRRRRARSRGRAPARSSSRRSHAPALAPAPAAPAPATSAFQPERPSHIRGLDGAGPVPTFLAGFDNEFVHFWKNIGMLGGLIAFVVYA